MTSSAPSLTRVSICIITASTPEAVKPLLESIQSQATDAIGSLTVSIVLVDNLPGELRRSQFESLASSGPFPLRVVDQPSPGIPAARNAALCAAWNEDAVIFVDDDERVPPHWLSSLIACTLTKDAEIVMGPVYATFPTPPPRWATASGVFDKTPDVPDGTKLRRAYTYNTLVRRQVYRDLGASFDATFRYIGSSDHDFFERARRRGYRTVLCRQAYVYESVDVARVSFRWLFRRGRRIGSGATLSSKLRDSRAFFCRRLAQRVAWNATLALWLLLASTTQPARSFPHCVRRFGILVGVVQGVWGRTVDEYRARHAPGPGPDRRGQR